MAATAVPLLEEERVRDGDENEREKWWKKVWDKDEAKKQVFFSLPMILANLFYFFINLGSVMFASQLGQLELAGATLGNSWSLISGFTFMIGLSGALETLCGQGFGAKLYKTLGIHLQAACITSFLFSMIICFLWLFTEPILIFVRQDPQIAKTAAIYVKFLIPGIFAYGFLQNILRFMQTQLVVWPLVLFSAIPLAIHIGLVYCLVNLTPLGFKGAPLAASISQWVSFLVLAIYVMFSKKFKHTWQGFSAESFSYIFTNLKLAVPSAAMVCLEYWAFDILVLIAGLMPNSEVTISLTAICTSTEQVAFMVAYGLCAAASTRVSNELGTGYPDKAKRAMFVSLMLSGLLAVLVGVGLGSGHDLWARSFSDSSDIINSFASMTPLLALSIVLDALQGVLSGVVRGCGWQYIGVYVNLATFYFVGMTIGTLLAFKFNLYTKGLWIGLICGLSCKVATLLLITLRTKWTKLQLSENSEKVDPVLA